MCVTRLMPESESSWRQTQRGSQYSATLRQCNPAQCSFWFSAGGPLDCFPWPTSGVHLKYEGLLMSHIKQRTSFRPFGRTPCPVAGDAKKDVLGRPRPKPMAPAIKGSKLLLGAGALVPPDLRSLDVRSNWSNQGHTSN